MSNINDFEIEKCIYDNAIKKILEEESGTYNEFIVKNPTMKENTHPNDVQNELKRASDFFLFFR